MGGIHFGTHLEEAGHLGGGGLATDGTEKIFTTHETLKLLAERYRRHIDGGRAAFATDEPLDLSAEARNKLYLVKFGAVIGAQPLWTRPPLGTDWFNEDWFPALDAWGRLLVYRCPGPIHRRGWDLYSLGGNGVDEQGRGDDLLVGEDIAVIASGK